MIHKYIYSITLILCIASISYGQSASFINNSSDARNVALGDGGYALTAGAFATHYNSAAILFTNKKYATAFSYMDWQPDFLKSSIYNLGGYYNINKKIGIAAGFKYNQHDKIKLTDDNNNNLKSFTPKEYAADLGIAYKIIESLAISANFRYISSDMFNKTGNSFAVDINAFYKLNHINIGAGITNIGSKIDYGGTKKHDLPSRIKTGISYEYELSELHTITSSADFFYQLKPSDFSGNGGGIGAEYSYKKRLTLRAGYHFGEEKKTDPNYTTTGCGINYANLTLDFAYIFAKSDSPIKNTLLISLGWSF